VEQVSFKSGMEERGSDGWRDVCYMCVYFVHVCVLFCCL